VNRSRGNVPEGDGYGRRRASAWERIYDGLALLLVAWPATGGMWLMGSTRVWGYGPGLVLSFLGSALLLARPLWFAETPRWRFPPGIGVLAALAAYAAIGMGFAAVPYAARWEALRWASLLAAAFAWTQLAGRRHRWKWLLAALLMAAALNSLYAWVQHVNDSRMVLWMERPEQYGMRASGTYLCPNHFANVLAMLMPAAIALLLLPEAGFPLRLMSVYFLVLSAPALYWTQSRSGWLGAMAGIGATVLLLAWRRSRRAFLLMLVALPPLAAAVGGLAWAALPAVRERMGAVIENPEKAGGIRMQMWRDAPAMVRDKPVAGFGGGSYVWIYPPYQKHVRQHLTWDFPHNEYVQVLVENGGIGLGLVLAGLLASAVGLMRGVRKARTPEGATLLAIAGGALSASLVHALFDFNFRVFPNPHVLAWMGGTAWGVWYAGEKGAEPSTGRSRRLRMAGAAAGAATCGFCAWVALSASLSYFWNLRGEMARAQLNWEEAAEDYPKAIAWDGWNWQPHAGLGHLKATRAIWYRDPDLDEEQRMRRELSSQAVAHFEAALERNPYDMAVEFGLARSLNAVGDAEGALEHYRRAAEFQRRHVFYREQLGVQLRRMGRDREALEVFRQNVENQTSTDVSRLNIRALERKLAREEAAAAAGSESVESAAQP
jgi:putative inorganic carbon (hco3(-)) transporter